MKAENRGEIERANKLNCELQTENEELRKKIEKSSDELMMKFKIAMDQLQDCIIAADEETAAKMKDAAVAVVSQL